MVTKKDLVKEISKKYKKNELIKILKKQEINVKKSAKKSDLLKQLTKLKVKELESILNPPKKAKKSVNEEVIRITLKPNKWTVTAIGLAIVILIIAAGSSTSNVNPSTTTTDALITYLIDGSCTECYDVSINEQIITTQYGIKLKTKTVDISSTEGQQLINKYNITKIPTFILTGNDIKDSTQLNSIWSSVGTIASDGALVFRAPEVISNSFKLLDESGKFMMYEPPVETIGRFQVLENDVCTEDDKPIIYFFGSNSCPHSKWQKPLINEVTAMFDGVINYHNNMGTQNDMDVFNDYAELNRGGVPFTIIGCQFVRVGSGETLIFYNDTIDELTNKGYNLSEPLSLLADSEVIKEQATTAYKNNDNETYELLAGNYSKIIDEASLLIDKYVLIDLICNVTNNEPASVCQ